MNDRDVLQQTREAVYQAYLGLLERYIRKREQGAPPADLDRVTGALQKMEHRTVWEEMKRQRSRIPELGELFEQVPEALEW